MLILDDGLNFFRGTLIGLGLSALPWALIVAAVVQSQR
jgi:hypothetical protein